MVLADWLRRKHPARQVTCLRFFPKGQGYSCCYVRSVQSSEPPGCALHISWKLILQVLRASSSFCVDCISEIASAWVTASCVIILEMDLGPHQFRKVYYSRSSSQGFGRASVAPTDMSLLAQFPHRLIRCWGCPPRRILQQIQEE